MGLIGALLLLVLFQLKHFVADFVLQSERMQRDKGYYGRASGVWHALVHVAGSAVILLPAFGPAAPVAAVLIGEGVAHYHIDWAKERLSRRLRLDGASPGFWRLLGLDQMAHQLTYLAMIGAVLP